MCNNCPKTTKVHFRAFITSFSDNHNAEWQGTKYAGRGENFYTYQGFDRSVQLGFLVAAQWTVSPPFYIIGFLCVMVQTAVRKQWNLVFLQLNGLVAWTIHLLN